MSYGNMEGGLMYIGQRVRAKNVDSMIKELQGSTGTIVDIVTSGQSGPTLYLTELDKPVYNGLSTITHMHFNRSEIE